jgi:alginate O-acetyltransferase complex protein AlgI
VGGWITAARSHPTTTRDIEELSKRPRIHPSGFEVCTLRFANGETDYRSLTPNFQSMSYYSLTFAAFLTAVVSLYFLVPQARRILVLLGASVLFYVSFTPQYIFVLFALILLDYCAGLSIEKAPGRSRKAWLVLSLFANLGLMAAFKYSPTVLGISLGAIPLGLSFHTFQAMAYNIEVYRGNQPAERSFLVFALYVLFFPQIAAGPIERPQNLLPQFREVHRFSYANAAAGLQLMVWGLFQKYVVAARLGVLVDRVYSNLDSCSGPLVAFTAVCFSFQIFGDFSGYSDIAIGTAQILGFRLTRNFNSPFHADSMAEYWKRWHISLSTWMRDYVFFPLCGRRPGMPRVCASIMVAFLANGLWHGARWNYLISGLLHGCYRVTELLCGRALSRSGWTLAPVWSRPVKIARTLLVFSLMTFAFIFFRGDNLAQSFHAVRRLFVGWGNIMTFSSINGGLSGISFSLSHLLRFALLISLVEAVQFLQARGPLRPRIAMAPAWVRWGLYYAGVIALAALATPDQSPFIYFQF